MKWVHITSITICEPVNLPVKKSEWKPSVMEIIVNIDITFGNLRPNKSHRRNYDTVEFRTLDHIEYPFYLGALFRLHSSVCTWPGGKLTTWVEKFKYLDIELSINSEVDLGKKIYSLKEF